MLSNFMNAGHDMTKATRLSESGRLQQIEMDGYHCYFDGGERGNCRYNLFTPEYEAWHDGYSRAEEEDKE